MLPDAFTSGPDADLYQWYIGIGICAVAAGLNIIGTEIVGTFSYVLVILVLLPFFLMVVFSGHTLVENRAEVWTEVPDPEAPDLGVKWGLFLSVVLWATSGWDEAGSVAGKVQDPAKSYTYGTSITILITLFVYLLPIGTTTLASIRAVSHGSLTTHVRYAMRRVTMYSSLLSARAHGTLRGARNVIS